MTEPSRTAILELTFNCNYSCLFCYVPWLENSALYGPELTIGEWCDVAERLIRHGVRHFTLSGGEALLKPGVERLIDFLKNHPEKPGFSVYTNGSLVTKALLEQLRDSNGSLALSLPGIKCYRELTGANITVYDLIDRFAEITKAGVPFSVGITVTGRSRKEWKQMASLAILSGAASVQIGPFVAEGRGKFHPELLLSYPEACKLEKGVGAMAKKTPVPLYYAGELFCSCRTDYIVPPGLPADYRPPECAIEKRLIVVGPDGRCRRCLHTPESLGDVRELFL